MGEHVVEACPNCDRCDIHRRLRKEPAFLCDKCQHEFEEPVERPPKCRSSGSRSSLDGLDPEDLGLSPIGER
ncbi:hypothetical protein [Halosimplex pelagicum]|uniref:Uncharacterized protein n=1 Tax=Halosimplex pelagicum TaxID=869886 RepID=A0A7D5SU30_9EURY|nr:hypothetical protein [Halosimplex pelagicum]QLH80967.1 hypothetical protein HZS54_04650 [Halosimplex pelagicum]